MKFISKFIPLLMLSLAIAGCAINKQPEWKPEAFRLKCVNGQLVAFNGLVEEIEVRDDDRECERVENLKRQKDNEAVK